MLAYLFYVLVIVHCEKMTEMLHNGSIPNLIIGTRHLDNVFEFEDSSDLKTPVGGYCYELLLALADGLNFTYSFKAMADREHGIKTSEGNWTGFVGMLVKKEADFIISDLSVSYERSLDVEFSHPYAYDAQTFITRTKPPKRVVKIFKIFAPETWYCALALFFGMHLLEHVISKLQANLDGRTSKLKLSDLLKQAPVLHTAPLSWAYLIFRTTWWLAVILLMTLFCADLTSFLNAKTHSHNIETKGQLRKALKDGTFNMGVFRGSVLHDAFKKMDGEDAVFAEYLEKHPENLLNATEDAIQDWMDRLEVGNFALNMEKLTYISILEERMKFPFHFSRDDYFSDYHSVAMRKGSPWREPINKKISSYQAYGMLRKWVLMPRRRKRKRNSGVTVQMALSVEDFLVVWLAQAAGYSAAFIILLLEKKGLQ